MVHKVMTTLIKQDVAKTFNRRVLRQWWILPYGRFRCGFNKKEIVVVRLRTKNVMKPRQEWRLLLAFRFNFGVAEPFIPTWPLTPKFIIKRCKYAAWSRPLADLFKQNLVGLALQIPSISIVDWAADIAIEHGFSDERKSARTASPFPDMPGRRKASASPLFE